MTLRDVAVFSPITVGWLTAAYFQIRAFRNLREPRPNERLFTLFFGEWGIRLHTVEGNRYRALAVLAFLLGAGITVLLDFTVPG